jgi:hypothetical protein
MKVERQGNRIIVIKEKGDPYFKSSEWNPDAESGLLHHVKKKLNKEGYNLAKVRMSKDGHLVDDLQHYLRPLKKNKDNSKNIYIYNPGWAIRGEEHSFNKEGKAEFMVVPDVYNNELVANPKTVDYPIIKYKSSGTWSKRKKVKELGFGVLTERQAKLAGLNVKEIEEESQAECNVIRKALGRKEIKFPPYTKSGTWSKRKTKKVRAKVSKCR